MVVSEVSRTKRNKKSDAALVCCGGLPLLLRVRVAHVKVAVEGELIERGEAVRGKDVARGADVDRHARSFAKACDATSSRPSRRRRDFCNFDFNFSRPSLWAGCSGVKYSVV